MFFSLRQDAQEPGDGQTILTPDPPLLTYGTSKIISSYIE